MKKVSFMSYFEILSKAIYESKFQSLISRNGYKSFYALYEEDPNREFLVYQIGYLSIDKKCKFLFNYSSGNVEVLVGPWFPGERDFKARLCNLDFLIAYKAHKPLVYLRESKSVMLQDKLRDIFSQIAEEFTPVENQIIEMLGTFDEWKDELETYIREDLCRKPDT